MREIGHWRTRSWAYPGELRDLILVDFDDAHGPHDKMRALRAMISKGAMDPLVNELAMAIVSHCPARDDVCEAAALQQWCQSKIRYADDGTQTFRDLGYTLSHLAAGGNCANAGAIVFGSLCHSIGIPVRLVVLARKTGMFTSDPFHVYCEVGTPRRAPKDWIPAEVTQPVAIGWDPAAYVAAHPEAAL
jgi:hypothetical protein